jgi:hypothetical protein
MDHLPPLHYRRATRVLVRFAAVMTIVGLLSGVLFQESAKKLTFAQAAPGANLEAKLALALVHGHVLVTAVVLPLVMALALDLARRSGGRELGERPLRWLVRGYLPFVCATVGLMLYKGYHVLLSVRFGATDFDAIQAASFGGIIALRKATYAFAHIGMSVTLGVFVIALFRSLRERPSA